MHELKSAIEKNKEEIKTKLQQFAFMSGLCC